MGANNNDAELFFNMAELKGINQEELDKLKKIYPFLDDIIQETCCVPLFKINFGKIDGKLLEIKTHDFSEDSGYEEYSHFYAVEKNKVYPLGMRISPEGDYEPAFPLPLIKEAILTLKIIPDFIVKAYYVSKKHNGDTWEDVELKIYEKSEGDL